MAAALLAIALPSSVEGQISTPLSLAGFVGPALLLFAAIRWNAWQRARIPWLLALAAIIAIATLISPFHRVAWGAAAPYLLASMVLLTDLRLLDAASSPRTDLLLLWMVLLIDCFLLATGFGILSDSSLATTLIQRHYQSLDGDLYERMVDWYAKPVTVFGSHSTAAFAYFSLFALNFRMAWHSRMRILARVFCLGSAVGFLILDWSLASNTSLVMAAIASAYLLLSLSRPMAGEWRALLLATCAVAAVAWMINGDIEGPLLGDSRDNGFLARYGDGGRLEGTYNYLAKNDLMPIGFSTSDEISLGDNFIAEYIVRVSPFGYAIILYLLWGWFRRHLGFRHAIVFFGFFLLADLAYPLLVYNRVAAALPFYVLLWRRLESTEFPGLGRTRTASRAGPGLEPGLLRPPGP